jgi:predicted nucleic acid-binding protein
MEGYLLDASVIYPLLDYIDKVDVKKVYILDLTFYEVGNAIWKDYRIHKKVKDPFILAKLFHELLRKFNVLRDLPMQEVMRVAVERGLTYYDASYVFAAISRGLTLVSNDKDLLEKGSAISFKEFIKTL